MFQISPDSVHAEDQNQNPRRYEKNDNTATAKGQQEQYQNEPEGPNQLLLNGS